MCIDFACTVRMALELMMWSEHVSKRVGIKVPFSPVLISTVNYVHTRLHAALSSSPPQVS